MNANKLWHTNTNIKTHPNTPPCLTPLLPSSRICHRRNVSFTSEALSSVSLLPSEGNPAVTWELKRRYLIARAQTAADSSVKYTSPRLALNHPGFFPAGKPLRNNDVLSRMLVMSYFWGRCGSLERGFVQVIMISCDCLLFALLYLLPRCVIRWFGVCVTKTTLLSNLMCVLLLLIWGKLLLEVDSFTSFLHFCFIYSKFEGWIHAIAVWKGHTDDAKFYLLIILLQMPMHFHITISNLWPQTIRLQRIKHVTHDLWHKNPQTNWTCLQMSDAALVFQLLSHPCQDLSH